MLAVASVVAPLALFALASWQSRTRHVAEAEHMARRTVDVLDEHARRVFEIQKLVLDGIDERVRGLSWSEIAGSAELHQYLRALDQGLEQVDGIGLIDPAANGRASSRFYPAPATSHVPDRDYFQALRDRDVGLYVGQPAFGRSVPDRLFLNLARRRSTPSGAFDGVIVASLQPAYFAGLYKALMDSPLDTTSLIRGDGLILSRGIGGVGAAAVLGSGSAFMQAIRHSEHGVYRTVSEIDGIERIYAFRRVSPFPVYVTYGRSLEAVHTAWWADMSAYGGLAAAAALALLGITALAMRRARQEQAAFSRWRDTEARYEALFSRSPTGLLLSDVRPDGSFVFEEINPALAGIVGLDPAQVVGRTPAEVFPGALGATIRDAYARCVATREPVEYEAEGEGPRGPFVRRVIVMPVLDAEGRVRKLLGTSMNVTETRRLEEQVRQMQKIEAVGQLTGGVAHDFNNLLSAVIGNLDLLRKRLPEQDARAKRYLDGALQGARRGAALTQRLLAFARRQDLQARPVDVLALVLGIRDLLERSLGPMVDVRYELPPALPAAHVDPNQLELAILNLAVNGRDAMPAGGLLTISVEAAELAETDGQGLGPGRFLRLRVSDTGMGMDAATLKRAVEPFFSTKGVGKGTGLGLSMVYGLAAQTGGALRLSSAPRQGTTAELWLPVAAEAAGEPAPRGPAPVLEQPTAAAILVVDDDTLILMSTAAMLEDLGHAVIEAESAARALEILRAGTRVDLLVTDFAMPGMSGLDLVRAARTHRPELPALLVTGYAELPEGAADDLPRLAKPFGQEQLAAELSALLDRTARPPAARHGRAGA